MTRADIPNIISVLRIGLVLPVVAALVHEQFTLALLLYTRRGLSDALDGYIAKRYHCASRLGSILDPLADKLLLVSTYVALAWLGLLPVWLVAAVAARDILILVGAVSYHLLIGEYEMKPTLISKLNTFADRAGSGGGVRRRPLSAVARAAGGDGVGGACHHAAQRHRLRLDLGGARLPRARWFPLKRQRRGGDGQ